MLEQNRTQSTKFHRFHTTKLNFFYHKTSNTNTIPNNHLILITHRHFESAIQCNLPNLFSGRWWPWENVRCMIFSKCRRLTYLEVDLPISIALVPFFHPFWYLTSPFIYFFEYIHGFPRLGILFCCAWFVIVVVWRYRWRNVCRNGKENKYLNDYSFWK